MVVVTESHVRKFLGLLEHGLSAGLGSPVPGQMCVEAAWCSALGLPHGDDPKCVSESLRRLKIRLNDSRWSSNQARAKGLRRLGVAQVGSLGVLDEPEFTERMVRLVIQTCVPQALRAAATFAKGRKQSDLLMAAETCEKDPTRENARKARDAANAANAAAYAANAANAAADAANAAAYAADAANAAYAAAAAANAAAAAAANAAAAAADAANAAAAAAAAADAANAAYAACDQLLSDFAEGVVQILIDMKAPGCQWLTLCEAT